MTTKSIMPHPPPGRHPTQKTPLERKLELLEVRFTRDPNDSIGMHSHHSFGFDAPSLLSNPTNLPLAANGTSPSNASTASRGFNETVQKATERHLSKVNQSKMVVWSSDTSNNSATVVANNCIVPDTPENNKDASKVCFEGRLTRLCDVPLVIVQDHGKY